MRCIEIYENEWYEVHDELSRSVNATLHSLAQRFWERCRVYGEDGTVWRPEPTDLPTQSFVMRMLVATGFYNPTRRISLSYKRVARYGLDDLKVKLQEPLSGVACEYGVDWSGATAEVEDQVLRAENFEEIARIIRAFRLSPWDSRASKILKTQSEVQPRLRAIRSAARHP